MKRKSRLLILLALALTSSMVLKAQSVNPSASYTDASGEQQTIAPGDSYSGSAPLQVHFQADATPEDYTGYYEWRFYLEGQQDKPYLIRYEQETDYTFTSAGFHRVQLYAKFTKGNDIVEFGEEDISPFAISISESKLEFPNAFSPNGDGINDIYKAKSGYQSIVEFDAYIFNRWGVKLYEWHDPAGGWDGKYKGKDVAQGVYYCLVKAKGADGRIFNFKKDVNLLRGYTESSSSVTQ